MTQNVSSNASSVHAPLACVVLAAGQGTRMKSDLPKVLHAIAGLPLIRHVLNVCEDLAPLHTVVVVGPNGKEIERAVDPVRCAIQPKPLGTGDAVKAAKKELKGFEGDVLVLVADGPLIKPETLRQMQTKRAATNATIVVGAFVTDEPGAYGRLVTDGSGNLSAIVEAAEATPEQKAITLCNGGILLFDAKKLWPLLDQLKDDNAKKEFFLTDCVSLAQKMGEKCTYITLSKEEVLGINNRVELAQAEKIMQSRLREKAMLAGVTMTDPESVFLSADTKFGRDIVIGPHVVIGPSVEIADGVDIRSFSHLQGAVIGAGAIIGPFARLRPGTTIGASAHIGNFVEIKNSEVGKASKVNHLSYVGDTTLGARVNIGAGTITANYDGFRKFRTQVGDDASTGSNSVLVAPVNIGEGSYIGAGSVITTDVPANALAVARGRQENREDWARRMREEKSKK
jgi:bifunctional UDP-N-acetylglucosamine pyrophosphorylase / glucosamine-1-phosphate N-acetyltransferase